MRARAFFLLLLPSPKERSIFMSRQMSRKPGPSLDDVIKVPSLRPTLQLGDPLGTTLDGEVALDVESGAVDNLIEKNQVNNLPLGFEMTWKRWH